MARKTIYSAGYRQLVQQLRTRREEKEMTQSALARGLGWPQQRLSAIEAGARRLDVMEFLHQSSQLGLAAEEAIRVAAQAYRTASTKQCSAKAGTVRAPKASG